MDEQIAATLETPSLGSDLTNQTFTEEFVDVVIDKKGQTLLADETGTITLPNYTGDDNLTTVLLLCSIIFFILLE